MEMKFCLFADYAGEGQRGKLLVVGIFDQITAAAAGPVMAPPFYIAALFEAHTVEGTEHQFEMRFLDQDHQPAGRVIQFPLRFIPQGPGRPLRAQLIVPVPQLVVPALGTYSFAFLEGGRLVGSSAFHVVLGPPPAA